MLRDELKTRIRKRLVDMAISDTLILLVLLAISYYGLRSVVDVISAVLGVLSGGFFVAYNSPRRTILTIANIEEEEKELDHLVASQKSTGIWYFVFFLTALLLFFGVIYATEEVWWIGSTPIFSVIAFVFYGSCVNQVFWFYKLFRMLYP